MNRHEEHQRAREVDESQLERTPEESKPLSSPEHQKKVRKTMNHVKRSMLVCMLAIVLTTLLIASGAQAAGLTGGKWRIVSSLNPGSSLNELLGVVAVSATTVWAVGDSANSRHGPSQTLIEQGNGTNWQVVSSPNPGSSNNVLQGVAAVSATDIWAVGFYYNTTKHKYQTLTELYS